MLVKREIRPLYFGLKNIILQEIESLDKEIDVHKFFIEEETAGFPASTHNMQAQYVANRSRAAMYQNTKYGGPAGATLNTVASVQSGQNEGFSETISEAA